MKNNVSQNEKKPMLKKREAPNKTTGTIFLPHTQKHVWNDCKKMLPYALLVKNMFFQSW